MKFSGDMPAAHRQPIQMIHCRRPCRVTNSITTSEIESSFAHIIDDVCRYFVYDEQTPLFKLERRLMPKKITKTPTTRKKSKTASGKKKVLVKSRKPVAVAKTQARLGAAPVSVGLQLSLGPRAGDPRELDELTRLLQAELQSLDVASVDLSTGDRAPRSSKGLALVAVGGLVVKMMSGEAFKNVIEAVKGWTSRNKGRSVKIVLGGDSFEGSDISSDQVERLIQLFERQSKPTSAARANG